MKISGSVKSGLLVGLVAVLAATAAHAQSKQTMQDDAIERARGDAEVATRQLTNLDALVRQRAAEELARLKATDRRRLVEGYRLQEKNDRVRLALDWALYRLGKPEALYAVVRALASNRYNQAQAYLAELETPEPLYLFLDRTDGVALARLIESLSRTGDAATLERIKPYADSSDPKVASAARFAAREIARRLDTSNAQTKAPPR
jgi:Ni/Co efflux regulator RcnB